MKAESDHLTTECGEKKSLFVCESNQILQDAANKAKANGFVSENNAAGCFETHSTVIFYREFSTFIPDTTAGCQHVRLWQTLRTTINRINRKANV